MSWLSSGLSNFTGQLSNFTKEVLTEGTEEIDDHVTQLKVARSRNSELEIICTTQRGELDRLKSTIDELSIQLQSKELQMQTSITEYRSAIGLKEAEVKALKLRQSEMSEHISSSHMLPVELVSVQKPSSGFDDECEDFTDVISSQHEINSLRLEIRRLETEVKHWRHLASPQLVNETLEKANISAHDQLQTRNKELENELAGIVDRHQNELTALQDAHRKTLTSLKQGHSSALEQLQKQLEEYKHTSSAATRDIAVESSHINDKLKHLEEINRKLECDLSQTHAADRKKAAIIEDFTLKLENSRNEIDLLSKNLEASASKCNEMLKEIQILSDERQELGLELNMANQLIRSKDHELQQLKQKTDLKDESICKTGFQTSMPIAAGKFRARTSNEIEASIVNDLTSYEELSEHNQMLDQQVRALQTQIESYEQELEQFELVKSDWQMEKQSLEDVLIKLRADLQKKEELLSIVQARKDLNSMGKEGKCSEGISARKRKTRLGREGLIEAEHGSGSAKRKLIVEGVYEEDDETLSDDSDDNIEVHAQKLDQKVSLLMKGNAELEEERDQLVVDKDKLMSELGEQRHLVNSLEEQLNDSKEAVKNAESRYFSLKEECDQIESELSVVCDNSVTVRCDDDRSSSRGDANPCAGCTSLKEQLEEYGRKMELMSKELVEKDRLHLLDMKVKSDQVGELMLEKQTLTIEKKHLIDSLDELDAQQSQAMEQMAKSQNEVLKSCEALKLQVEDLEEQLVVNEAKLAAVEEEESDKMAALESKSEELNAKWVSLELALKDSKAQKTRLEEQTISQMEEIKRLAYQVMCLEDEKNKTAERLKSLSSSVRLDPNARSDSAELEFLQKHEEELQTVRLEAGRQAHQLLELTAENNKLNESKQNLHLEIENLTKTLNLKDEKMNALQIELADTRSEIENGVEQIQLLTNEHEKLIESVRVMEQAITSKETEMLSFKENYERLKSVAEQTEAEVDRLSKLCKELTETNVNLEEKLKILKLSVVEKQEFARNGDLENEQTDFKGQDLCDEVTESSSNSIPVASSSNSSFDAEINRLKSTVVQQEELIRTLNGKYSSMLRLLEDRSLESHGNTTLVDIHHMETEVQSLRKEREHMIAILDEKTREASSLKSEVHRLMNVVSAGKAAIAKLQQDSQEMSRNNGESLNEDMKKEAIRKLSQMIKDKDFEIEALSQKNSTLLQVLQSSSPEATGTQVSQLIQERDNLRKQLAIFQSDREQLINALNTKHQESVAYYEDCLRLKTAVTEMTEQRETLERNCSNLSQQYDDKHKSLMKALNELSNYRQKLSEMEKQSQKFGSNKSDKGDTDKSSFSRIFYIRDSAATTMLNATENVPKSEKEQNVTEKNQLIQDFEQRLAERDSILIARDQEISKLSQLVSQLEAALSAKESDLTTLRKMCDNLTFKVQSASVDHSELSHEIDNLRSRCEALSSELLSLKQVNSSLMVGSNQKDFELNALKERLNSLNQATNQADSSMVANDQHNADLVRHIEALTRQSQGLQQERDQVYIALQYQQAESSELKNELTRLSEKEQRLMKECERLRGHLVHIEEGYTREAIEAEEREKQLRNQLTSAEEKISSSSAVIHSTRSDSNKHVENLQIQLHALAEQRDNALLQLSSAQETISSYASSLSNLQMVLEQFQSERQHQQSIEIEKCQRSLQQKQAECQQLQSQIHQLQIQLEEKTDALKAAQRLSEQIDRKQEMISALREEVLLREAELTRAENEIHKLTSHTEDRVDKLLMKSLLTGYFHAPASKRAEALQVIGHILDFSKEELKEVGVMTSASEGSWIGGLFRKKSASISVPRSQTTKNTDQSTSFSELFVSFLEKESLPPAFARLPTERMVEEQQQKKAAPFNPFSVPMHSNSPPTLVPEASSIMASGSKSSLLMDTSNNSSPFFMRPISPHNFPVFAPVSNRDKAASDPPRFAVGRDSNSSSQRSTPTGSMLRDVLQQK